MVPPRDPCAARRRRRSGASCSSGSTRSSSRVGGRPRGFSARPRRAAAARSGRASVRALPARCCSTRRSRTRPSDGFVQALVRARARTPLRRCRPATPPTLRGAACARRRSRARTRRASGLDRVRRHICSPLGAAVRRAARRGRAVFGAWRGTRGGGDRAAGAARGAPRRAVRPHGDRAARAAALRRPARARARARRRPAYFERGTRRPHPAGRAFLSLLACALDNCRRGRFAEYLSLGQVPDAGADARRDPATAFPTSSDEVFGALGERAEHGRRRQRSKSRPTRESRRAGAACLPRAVEVGAPARRIARHRRRRALGAPAERADPRMRAAAARAGAHRARVAADRPARAEDRRPQSAGGVRAADHADARRVARAGDLGRVAGRFAALAPRVLRRPDACCACSPTCGRWARSGR